MKKCLNEWNATVEALGQGRQTILIRKYGTTVENFLLYPTASYAFKNDFLRSFEIEYKAFASANLIPKKEDGKTEIKYYAEVEDVVEKSSQRIGTLNKYHVWTKEHINSYLNNKKAKIWILRVYKLKEPVMVQTNGGTRYANLKDEVPIAGMKPVLTDEIFSSLKKEIECMN